MDLLLGKDGQWYHLLGYALRSACMFGGVLLLFKLTGKKEVRQFSMLELVVIIGLGSAIGDPMLHSDVGLLQAGVVVLVVLVCYRVVNKWTNRSRAAGDWLEGRVVRVLTENGVDRKALDGEGLSVDELFGELRVKQVDHLGQVRAVYVEVNGDLSVYFRDEEEVRPGLPIEPELLADARPSSHAEPTPVSCRECGYTASVGSIPRQCPQCGSDAWVKSSMRLRLT